MGDLVISMQRPPSQLWCWLKSLQAASPIFLDLTVHCRDGSIQWNRLWMGLAHRDYRVLLELESPVSAVFLPDLGLEELQQQLEGAFMKSPQGNSAQETGVNTEENDKDNYIRLDICSKTEGIGIDLKSREFVESQDTLLEKYSSSKNVRQWSNIEETFEIEKEVDCLSNFDIEEVKEEVFENEEVDKIDNRNHASSRPSVIKKAPLINNKSIEEYERATDTRFANLEQKANYENYFHTFDDKFERLPHPLSKTPWEFLRRYISRHIIIDYEVKHCRKLKFLWGDERLRPDFWPEELYPWGRMTAGGFSNSKAIKEGGVESVIGLMKEVVRRRLTLLGVDPEQHTGAVDPRALQGSRLKAQIRKEEASLEQVDIFQHMGPVRDSFSTGVFRCCFDSCKKWNKTFAEVRLLKNHYMDHDPDMKCQFSCPMCSKTFRTKKDVSDHKTKVHRNEYLTPIQTPKKIKQFNLQLGVIRSAIPRSSEAMKTVNKDCSICSESFNTLNSFEDHAKIHDLDLIRFTCRKTHCSEVFREESVFLNHEKSHQSLFMATSKGSTAMCYGCSQYFPQISEVKTHIRRKHPHMLNGCNFCEHCPAFFKCKLKLETHMLNHSKKPHRCHHCHNRMFASVKSLNLHLLNNSCSRALDQKYKGKLGCSFCDKSFTRHNLEGHIQRVHDCLRPYQCNTCEKRFDKHFIDDHIRMHQGQTESPGFTLIADNEARILDQEDLEKIKQIKQTNSKWNRPCPYPMCGKMFTKDMITKHVRQCKKASIFK